MDNKNDIYSMVYGEGTEEGKNNKSVCFVKNRLVEQGRSLGDLFVMKLPEFISKEIDGINSIEDFHYNSVDLGKTVSLKYNPDADFDYYTSSFNRNDGTFVFMKTAIGQLFQEKFLYKLNTYCTEKENYFTDPNVKEIIYEVGDFVINCYAEDEHAPKTKKWMNEIFQACLPIKMVAVYKD